MAQAGGSDFQQALLGREPAPDGRDSLPDLSESPKPFPVVFYAEVRGNPVFRKEVFLEIQAQSLDAAREAQEALAQMGEADEQARSGS